MAIFEGVLAESLSSDDSIPVLWNIQGIIAESLTSEMLAAGPIGEVLYINGTGTNTYGTTRTYQSILTTAAWKVESVWADDMFVLGGGSVAVLKIYKDEGGDPDSGTLVGTSDNTTVGDSDVNRIAATFNFSTPASLLNATSYFLIFEPVSPATAVYTYRTDSSVYADGGIGYSTDDGVTWVTSDETLYDFGQLKVNASTGIEFVQWNAQAILAESLSSDDGLIWTWAVEIAESLTSDDSIAVQWSAQCVIADSLSSDDTPLVQWNAQGVIAETLLLDDEFIPKHSNPYGRYRYSLNYQGNTLQLKIQHNTAGQGVFLHDIGALIYAHEKPRQNQYSVNVKGHSIQLKFQNNTAGEFCHFFDYGVDIHIDEER